jgi:beta-N-acetylhexosaminidase
MSPARTASLISAGFAEPYLSDQVKRLIDRGVGGLILFSRNVESPAQVAQLVYDLKTYAGRPLLVGIDQEGGVVQRLKQGFTRIPTMRELGRTRSVELARKVGEILGRELRAVGIDVDYAPVVDVDSNPHNPVIGNRSLGSDPALVAELGVALGRGIESQGVASCAKHFPGHGDTDQDSHTDLPRIQHSRPRLDQVELHPFSAWAEAGLASVMSAHVVVDELEAGIPATLSRVVLHDFLREKMGYRGLIVSDDMEMKAVARHFQPEQAAIMGINAGIDHFLICHSEEVVDAYLVAIEGGLSRGEVHEDRYDAACEQVAQFTSRWARPPQAPDLEILASEESSKIMDAITRGRVDEKDAGGERDPTEHCHRSD